MKIRFDGNQQYQLDAIDAVLDLFEGQPLASGAFEIRLDPTSDTGGLFTELGSGNLRTLTDEAVLDNAHRIQQRNGIPGIDAPIGMNFSVEMETGTGKTYV